MKILLTAHRKWRHLSADFIDPTLYQLSFHLHINILHGHNDNNNNCSRPRMTSPLMSCFVQLVIFFVNKYTFDNIFRTCPNAPVLTTWGGGEGASQTLTKLMENKSIFRGNLRRMTHTITLLSSFAKRLQIRHRYLALTKHMAT